MICVDASLAAKWMLPEEHSQQALRLLRVTLDAGEPVIAPHFLRVEVTNILRQRMRRGEPPLSLEEASERLRAFIELPLQLMTPEGLHERALDLATTYALPATYDAHYVVLAQEMDCPLWTDDNRLLSQLDGRLPFVRSIETYTDDETMDRT